MVIFDYDLIKDIVSYKKFSDDFCFYINEEKNKCIDRKDLNRMNREIRKYNNLRDKIFNNDYITIKATTYDDIVYIILHTDNKEDLLETLKDILIFIDILNTLYDMNPKIIIENFYLNGKNEIEYDELFSCYENKNITIKEKN